MQNIPGYPPMQNMPAYPQMPDYQNQQTGFSMQPQMAVYPPMQQQMPVYPPMHQQMAGQYGDFQQQQQQHFPQQYAPQYSHGLSMAPSQVIDVNNYCRTFLC